MRWIDWVLQYRRRAACQTISGRFSKSPRQVRAGKASRAANIPTSAAGIASLPHSPPATAAKLSAGVAAQEEWFPLPVQDGENLDRVLLNREVDAVRETIQLDAPCISVELGTAFRKSRHTFQRLVHSTKKSSNESPVALRGIKGSSLLDVGAGSRLEPNRSRTHFSTNSVRTSSQLTVG